MRDDETITLDADAVKAIRHALLVGLDSFGEIERVRDHVAVLKKLGQQFPDAIIPCSTSPDGKTIGDFACALAWLN